MVVKRSWQEGTRVSRVRSWLDDIELDASTGGRRTMPARRTEKVRSDVAVLREKLDLLRRAFPGLEISENEEIRGNLEHDDIGATPAPPAETPPRLVSRVRPAGLEGS